MIHSLKHRVHLPESKKSIVSQDVKFMSELAFRHEYREILDDPDEGRVGIHVDIREPRVSEENQSQEEEDSEKLKQDRSQLDREQRKILRATRGSALTTMRHKMSSKSSQNQERGERQCRKKN